MLIKSISVTKLFGIFDHSLPINESGITIVIGENGIGKTILLESITAFFGRNYLYFKTLDFEKFTFEFTDHRKWELTKSITKSKFSLNLSASFPDKPGKPKIFKLFEIDKESDKRNLHIRTLLSSSDRPLTVHERILFAKASSETSINFDAEFKKLRLSDIFLDAEYQHPRWFTETTDSISVQMIETQRVITAKEIGGESYTNAVLKSSEELTSRIAKVDKEAALVATELDSTYPSRLFKSLKKTTNEEPSYLSKSLSILDSRRHTLSHAGLIEVGRDQDILEFSSEQKELLSALHLYVEDSNKKLEPYNDISEKIIKLKEIINKRFKHKKLEINKKTGFLFRSTVRKLTSGEGEEISPTKLSSGEQHELILFYKLIFNSSPGDLILIDEPELSLHISWQNQFINDLKTITSMNSTSVVIATHSPDIINDNWNLKVDLIGLE